MDVADLTLDELRLALAPGIADSAVFDGWSVEALDMAADQLGADRDVARLAFKDDGGRPSVNSNSLCCSGGVMCLCVCVCVRIHLCMHGYMHASSEYSDTLNACTFSGRVCKCAHVCVPKRTLQHVPCLHKTSEQH